MIALWEFYGMLDHKGLPNFKITAMICGGDHARAGVFITFAKFGPARSYDFETGGVALLSADRFHPADVRQPAR